MFPKVSRKPLSSGDLVLCAGLVVALVGSFLTWRSASIPPGYACSAIRQCASETGAFNASHSAFLGWQGWVFFIAALLGLALLVVRNFFPHVTISPMPRTDAPVYAVIAAVMLLMALMGLLVGVGARTAYYVTTAGGVYTLGPGIGVFIGIAAAVLVAAGAFLMRGPHMKVGPMHSSATPAMPPPAA